MRPAHAQAPSGERRGRRGSGGLLGEPDLGISEHARLAHHLSKTRRSSEGPRLTAIASLSPPQPQPNPVRAAPTVDKSDQAPRLRHSCERVGTTKASSTSRSLRSDPRRGGSVRYEVGLLVTARRPRTTPESPADGRNWAEKSVNRLGSALNGG